MGHDISLALQYPEPSVQQYVGDLLADVDHPHVARPATEDQGGVRHASIWSVGIVLPLLMSPMTRKS
jgi:hypothetical protein